MKEKILSSFPYLLLALFFVAILALNNDVNMAQPVFSYNSEDVLPEISTENAFTETEIPKIESENSEPNKENNVKVEIIESKQDENSENICFYTKNGTKYHFKEDCRYLKNSTKIIKTTLDFAIELELEPCSGCKD